MIDYTYRGLRPQLNEDSHKHTDHREILLTPSTSLFSSKFISKARLTHGTTPLHKWIPIIPDLIFYELRWRNLYRNMTIKSKDFGTYVESTSRRLKEASCETARRLNRPIIYLPSCNTPKEPIARKIVQKDGITDGLIITG